MNSGPRALDLGDSTLFTTTGQIPSTLAAQMTRGCLFAADCRGSQLSPISLSRAPHNPDVHNELHSMAVSLHELGHLYTPGFCQGELGPKLHFACCHTGWEEVLLWTAAGSPPPCLQGPLSLPPCLAKTPWPWAL